MLEQFGLVLRVRRILLFLIDSVLIVVLQVVRVLVDHANEMRFGPDLVILDSLELLLLFLQVKNAVLIDYLINLILLIFDIVVSTSIRLECAFHVLVDSVGRVQSVLRELLPIVVLGVLAIPHHVGLDSKAVRLFLVHLVHELLFALQLLYALVCLHFLLFQFYDSVFKLMLLVLLLLCNYNCVHHYILRLLHRNGTHS